MLDKYCPPLSWCTIIFGFVVGGGRDIKNEGSILVILTDQLRGYISILSNRQEFILCSES